MTELHIDFETRSAVDIKKHGLDIYAKDRTTDVVCLGYAFDDDPPAIWTPADGMLPPDVSMHVYEGGTVIAHNVPFELAIWNNVMRKKYGAPSFVPAQSLCTMAMAYAMALPGSLENAAAAVGLRQQKDMAGHRLMLQLCRPRSVANDGTITWWSTDEFPERYEKLYAYCKQDVIVERELCKRLLRLTDKERRVWMLDYEINQRGVRIDRAAVKSALEVVIYEQDRLNQRLRDVTGNYVGFATETARLTAWVRNCGVPIQGVAKAEVLDALESDRVPDRVKRALSIRKLAGRTSTSKLKGMLDGADFDGRVRQTIQYHGAATGRFAGRRLQPHNFPRPTLKQGQIEQAFKILESGTSPQERAEMLDMIGAPMNVIADCLRGLIIPGEGNDFVAGDWSNVEGRGIAWLAGEEWKLDAFRAYDAGTGPDIYLIAARMIWDREFTKDDPERQHGKVAELACGYQGGVGAFQTMAKTYLVKIEDSLAKTIVDRWRERHPAIVTYWYALEGAALNAVRCPGEKFFAGPTGRQVFFKVAGSFLWCRLPSGRALCYPYPELREIATPWGTMKETVTYKTVPSQDTKIVGDPNNASRWARVSTYGGKLAENITQAICRDILTDCLLRLNGAGYKTVLHVHDEVVAEIPCDAIGEVTENFQRIMEQVPEWAAGFPLAAGVWRGKRYKKG